MQREKDIVKVSIIGIITNIFLVIFKMIVGFLANSIAIILDGLNNLSDVLSSLITIIGTKLSLKRPDKKHPYGYGRVEYFASIIIAFIVLIAGLVSLKESIDKIITPVKASYNLVFLFIILVAVVAKFVLGRYFKKRGKELNSNSLVVSGIDALSDSVLSFVTLLSAIVTLIFDITIEGYLGLVISLLILKSASSILKDTIDQMIGLRADSMLTKKIRKTIMNNKGVLGVYDLILHNYGPNNLIGTAHIEVKDSMTAKEIHKLTRNITIEIFNLYNIVLTLGIYASNDKKEYQEIKKYIKEVTSDYKNVFQVHGFYVDEEKKQVSFDLIFKFEEDSVEKVSSEIIDKLKSKYNEYDFNIIIDTDFSD